MNKVTTGTVATDDRGDALRALRRLGRCSCAGWAWSVQPSWLLDGRDRPRRLRSTQASPEPQRAGAARCRTTKDNVERAKELFVYGPIGLAMYVRDTAPSFLKVFVARGRAEVEQRRKSVGDHLGQVREMGESAAGGGAPQLLKLVSDGLARVRETAEGALGALGTLSGDDARFSSATGEPGHDAARWCRGRDRRGNEPSVPLREVAVTRRRSPGDPRLRRPLGIPGRRSARRPRRDGPRGDPLATRSPIVAARRSSGRSSSSPEQADVRRRA